uniref:Uncharacterized protein n=1 Tax=Varanus komodoensis TaxID=61221 RepID=A0A8D2IWB6_VARKO
METRKSILYTVLGFLQACKWPKEQWVTRLVPALNGAALQAYNSLDPRESGDYGKVKAAILREDAVSLERQRQSFRHFRYQEAEGPRDVCARLRGLCHRWLEPESRSKEQIVELLILEQFLTILPEDMQDWVQEYRPKTCIQAVTLAEHFLLKQQEGERWDQQGSTIYIILTHEQGTDKKTLKCLPLTTVKSQPIYTYLGRLEKQLLVDQNKLLLFSRQNADRQPVVNKQAIHKQDALFPCPECGKNFSRKSTLTRHRRVHTGVKPHQCTECGKRFLHNLRVHERVHTGDRPFSCALCGKAFKQSNALASHERVHTGERPFACPTCGKAFKQSSYLAIHARSHTGERPYACGACSKAFARPSLLLQHQRVHSSDRPHRHRCAPISVGTSVCNVMDREFHLHPLARSPTDAPPLLGMHLCKSQS